MQLIEPQENDQQRTEEWYKQRLGRFSCSQFYRLMTEPRLKADKEAGNLSDGAMTYVYECVAERLTGKRAKDEFTSKYTEHGIDNEPVAKGIYNAVFNCTIEDSPYIEYGVNGGGSPDGLIAKDGVIEIKCPYTITSHLQHKLIDLIDVGKSEYYWQCLGYLLITGRTWIDFVSYHPDYPGKLQIVYKRLNRADLKDDLLRLQNKLNKATKIFTTLVDSLK